MLSLSQIREGLSSVVLAQGLLQGYSQTAGWGWSHLKGAQGLASKFTRVAVGPFQVLIAY